MFSRATKLITLRKVARICLAGAVFPVLVTPTILSPTLAMPSNSQQQFRSFSTAPGGNVDISQQVADIKKRIPYVQLNTATGNSLQLYCHGLNLLKSGSNYEAIEVLKQSAAQGFTEAMTELGICYRDGVGVAANQTEAIKYFRQAALRKHNYADIIMIVYDHEIKTNASARLQIMPRDEFLRKVQQVEVSMIAKAKTGDFSTQCSLAEMYLLGRGGVAVDPMKAFPYLVATADKGHLWSQIETARLYQTGAGGSISHEKSYHYAKLAADRGQYEAQYYVGQFYLFGMGVAQNSNLGAKYLHMSAAQGYGYAQSALGFCYMNGQGVPQDRTKSKQFFTLAAAQGVPEAIAELKRA